MVRLSAAKLRSSKLQVDEGYESVAGRLIQISFARGEYRNYSLKPSTREGAGFLKVAPVAGVGMAGGGVMHCGSAAGEAASAGGGRLPGDRNLCYMGIYQHIPLGCEPEGRALIVVG